VLAVEVEAVDATTNRFATDALLLARLFSVNEKVA